MMRCTGYTLRPATFDDFEFVFGLERAAFRDHVIATYGEWDDRWQRDRLESRFDPPAMQIVVAGGRAVGELLVDWERDPVFLAAIELLPEVQGRGLGTAIIGDLLARAQQLGIGVCLQVFVVNKRARALYERLGFHATSSSQTHTQMSWDPA